MHSAIKLAFLSLLGVSLAEVISIKSASQFAILGNSGLNGTGESVGVGNVGDVRSDDTAVEGVTATGQIILGDVAQTALEQALFAGQQAANLTAVVLADDFSGATLTAGVYHFEHNATLNGEVTLSGPGFFYFTVGNDITVGDGSAVVLAGASPDQILWFMGDGGFFGSNIAWAGTVVTTSRIVAGAGTTFDGAIISNKFMNLTDITATARDFTDPDAPNN